MKMFGRKITGWQDFLELGIASWLVLSPFALGFLNEISASVTAMLLGSVAIMFSVLGLSTQKPLDEWGTELTAVCLVLSPWVFDYAHVQLAVVNALSCGVLLAFLAWLAMMEEKADMRKEQETRMEH
ncbi:MAG: SPW repeat protein [Gammaproteobacteria bacterium]|nr:SPW repeat protein [Gammaproteobacteria bacterium]